jgi:NDP-sugar pyrophosphorylase family protein
MKAMLFAAGLGTRLKPLTDTIPKALVVVAGKTLLERAIIHLASQGVTYIVINVHHHAEQIIRFVQNHGNFGLDIYFSDESNELLETGGGLLKAANHFIGNQPFVVINSDVISNINIPDMMEVHKKSKALVTLAVRNRPESSRQLLFDEDRLLCGKIDKKKGTKLLSVEKPDLREFAFSGIQIVSPEWFSKQSYSGKFSIIDAYLELCKTNKIIAYLHDNDYWFDAGSVEKIEEANFYLNHN